MLEARDVARSLRRIRDDVVAQPASGRKLEWYQGADAFTDLFLERDRDGSVAWLQWVRGGRYLDCDLESGRVVTGRTGDFEPGDGWRHAHSRALERDACVDLEQLDDLIGIVAARADEPPFDVLRARLRAVRARNG